MAYYELHENYISRVSEFSIYCYCLRAEQVGHKIDVIEDLPIRKECNDRETAVKSICYFIELSK